MLVFWLCFGGVSGSDGGVFGGDVGVLVVFWCFGGVFGGVFGSDGGSGSCCGVNVHNCSRTELIREFAD